MQSTPVTPTCSAVALSLVVPCYNEADGLGELLRRTTTAAEAEFGDSYEIVLVDDGSADETWSKISEAADRDGHIVGVKLARNHGHQIALTAGLHVARGERVFVIDADLQDPPELIGPMHQVMQSEQADVVYGRRRTRSGETPFKKMSASIFYRLLARTTVAEIPKDTGDFRLMTRRIAKLIAEMPEQDRFIRGMVAWLGYKQVPFDYERDARFAGSTKYPFKKMLLFAVDAFVGFSMVPLRIAAYIAALLFALVIVGLIYTIIVYVTSDTVQGWTSLMLLILLVSGVQLAALAVIGEYVGRTYLSTKQRPLFLIDEIKIAEAMKSGD